MKTTALSVILLVTLSVPASADVTVDYDISYDFAGASTVAWGEGGTPASELSQPRIESSVGGALFQEGLVLVDPAKADLLVVTHVGSSTRQKQSNARVGVSVGTSVGSSGRGRIGVGGSRAVGGGSTVLAGSLVIQLYDRATGKLVWESRATDTVSSPDPDKIQKAIDKAVSKSFKKYPPKSKK
jgi:hypothetical protein